MGAKSRAQLEAEVRALKAGTHGIGIYRLGEAAIKFGSILGIVREARVSIEAVAGKETNANIRVGATINQKINQSTVYGLTPATSLSLNIAAVLGIAICYFWVRGERQLRKASILEMGTQIRTLERMIDPLRSSSKLTTTGDTRPEDE